MCSEIIALCIGMPVGIALAAVIIIAVVKFIKWE